MCHLIFFRVPHTLSHCITKLLLKAEKIEGLQPRSRGWCVCMWAHNQGGHLLLFLHLKGWQREHPFAVLQANNALLAGGTASTWQVTDRSWLHNGGINISHRLTTVESLMPPWNWKYKGKNFLLTKENSLWWLFIYWDGFLLCCPGWSWICRLKWFYHLSLPNSRDYRYAFMTI